ncbi:MAG: arginine--tRNA ligase [Candidatus Eremiobacteraeota bacterium]|nr:arginine--tRNA ligase [Candidatus Eremiobacteraeota bacterium]
MNPITTQEHAPGPQRALADFTQGLQRAIDVLFGEAPSPIAFEAPRRPEFGDFSTNIAFSLARIARRSPKDVAALLIQRLIADSPYLSEYFSEMRSIDGFINVRLAPQVWQECVEQIVRAGDTFGKQAPNGQHISLEFGSANPTGPLVVVQGRTTSIGATLANAFRYCGYEVFTEWIINDAGAQIETLSRSLYARYRQVWEPKFPFPENGYRGDYLLPIAKQISEHDGDGWCNTPEEQWLPYFGDLARDRLVAEQQATVERFGVTFDLWQSERTLHDCGAVQAGLERLAAAHATFDRDGALYFRASAFGDDKDRVLIRSDGRPTYLAVDVAYHYDKLRRADRIIDILGPDHHGYIGRLHGLAEALGYKGALEVLIAQQITLMRGNEQVSMSKRGGHIVTLEEILEEVGKDAARFFFVMLAPESPLTFDLELAKQQNNDNPVYYVQYGHARIASVLKNTSAQDIKSLETAVPVLTPLVHAAELSLARRLSELPLVVQNTVRHLAPHRLTRYARDVASDFHQFYTECRILAPEQETRLARLALCIATKHILARVLALIGVTAPDSM